MNIFLRTLAATTLLSSPTFAQMMPEPPEIPRFQLSAGVVGFDRAPELYWMDVHYDAEGLPVTTSNPLDVGVGRRGGLVEIPIPKQGSVRADLRTANADYIRNLPL